jgi:hypothetical protein
MEPQRERVWLQLGKGFSNSNELFAILMKILGITNEKGKLRSVRARVKEHVAPPLLMSAYRMLASPDSPLSSNDSSPGFRKLKHNGR